MTGVFQCENIRENTFFYIVCDMGFKNKTYGLNPLVIF